MSLHKVDLGGWVLLDGAYHLETQLGTPGYGDLDMETEPVYFDVMKKTRINY